MATECERCGEEVETQHVQILVGEKRNGYLCEYEGRLCRLCINLLTDCADTTT